MEIAAEVLPVGGMSCEGTGQWCRGSILRRQKSLGMLDHNSKEGVLAVIYDPRGKADQNQLLGPYGRPLLLE